MPQCCAFGCFSRSEDAVKLFSVPIGERNKERGKIWMHRIGRDDWRPRYNSRLCEEHFTPDQFERKTGWLDQIETKCFTIYFHPSATTKRKKAPFQRIQPPVGALSSV